MMNTRILIIFMLIISIVINAQGRRKNESSIHAEYGYIPTKSADTLKEASFMAKVGYMRVIGDKGFLGKVEGFYQRSKVLYTGNQYLPYEKYGLNVSAGYSYEGLYPVLLNAYVGVYGAYEKANEGNEKDPLYNAKIPAKVKGFVYGFSGSAEVEVVLVRRLSLLVNYTQLYDIKSEFSKSNYAFFGGVRYYVN